MCFQNLIINAQDIISVNELYNVMKLILVNVFFIEQTDAKIEENRLKQFLNVIEYYTLKKLYFV